MKIPLRAIETTGTIESERTLVLDEPLSAISSHRARVIILIAENSEIGEEDWLRSAAENSAFDFLNDAEEDIYSLADGRPFDDKR